MTALSSGRHPDLPPWTYMEPPSRLRASLTEIGCGVMAALALGVAIGLGVIGHFHAATSTAMIAVPLGIWIYLSRRRRARWAQVDAQLERTVVAPSARPSTPPKEAA